MIKTSNKLNNTGFSIPIEVCPPSSNGQPLAERKTLVMLGIPGSEPIHAECDFGDLQKTIESLWDTHTTTTVATATPEEEKTDTSTVLTSSPVALDFYDDEGEDF